MKIKILRLWVVFVKHYSQAIWETPNSPKDQVWEVGPVTKNHMADKSRCTQVWSSMVHLFGQIWLFPESVFPSIVMQRWKQARCECFPSAACSILRFSKHELFAPAFPKNTVVWCCSNVWPTAGSHVGFRNKIRVQTPPANAFTCVNQGMGAAGGNPAISWINTHCDFQDNHTSLGKLRVHVCCSAILSNPSPCLLARKACVVLVQVRFIVQVSSVWRPAS